MDVQFGDIFAGKAPRRRKPQYQRLVETISRSRILDDPNSSTPRLRQSARQSLQCTTSLRTGYPNDCDSGRHRSARQRINRCAVESLIHFAYCHPLHHLYPAYEAGPLATSPIRNSFLRSRYFLRQVVGMGLPKRGGLKKTRARTNRGWISERGRLMSDNRLANATSPYLLQHKDNPVDWRPWGTEALEEAKALDKPILLSVGYAACHWCHVMA